MTRLLMLLALMAAPTLAATQQPPRFIHVWGTALDTMPTVRDSSFTARRKGAVLITVDLRTGSVVRAIIADTAGRSAHHTEHALAADGQLFANDFGPGRTFRFDLRTAGEPRLLGSFTTAGPFAMPHSFVLLPNGNILATYQGQLSGPPGGIAELRRDGVAVRWARAATGGVDSTHIQPYSLEVVPALDRVITTSTSMVSDVGVHVQIWRLSDLALLHTLEVPAAPTGHSHERADSAGHMHHMFPGEPRLLADGRTIMLGTFTCGLYTITGLDGAQPTLHFSSSFPGENCAVPARIGKWWIQTVPALHALVALDVSDALHPRESSRLTFEPHVRPHWLAADASGQFLVMNSGSGSDARLHLVRFDEQTGSLRHHTMRTVELGRITVPQLGVVRVAPHGTIFQ